MDCPINIPVQLGPMLVDARRSKKLTQAAVGLKAGLAQNAISALENDPSKASFDRIMKVLTVLDLDLIVRKRPKQTRKPGW